MLQLLIVEDEEELARNIKVFLESFREEFSVTVAGSGEVAVRQLSDSLFDLLVADFRLPGIDGLEVLRHALDRNPGMRAIMMTAYPSEELRRRALRSGAVRFVEKPLDLEDLRLLLWETIESGGEEKAGLTVGEFVELLELAGESQAFRFRFAKDEGVIVVDHGCLIHAATATLSGPDAFERMARWVVTDVQELPHESVEACPKNIEIPLRQQVLEATLHLGDRTVVSSDHEQQGDEEATEGQGEQRSKGTAEFLQVADSLGKEMPGQEDRSAGVWHHMESALLAEDSAPVHGTLGDVGLSAVLHLLCKMSGTWRMKLRTRESSAVVYVADGVIVHAAMGSADGEEVVCSLVTWKVGEFEVEAVLEAPRRTLTPEWSSLFLRAFA